jgi:hypothetical protein
MLKSSALIGLLGMPLAACGGAPPEPSTPPPSPTAGVRTRVDLAAMVEAALVAAAEKTGIARAGLEVVSSEAVVWSDGSIGCAEPGMNYTMALVPGYRIIIEANGQRLDYHATERGYLILCPPGRAVGPSTPDAT